MRATPHVRVGGRAEVSVRCRVEEPALTCLCADPGTGPYERGEHRPIEWGRRVCGGWSSTRRVARCGVNPGPRNSRRGGGLNTEEERGRAWPLHDIRHGNPCRYLRGPPPVSTHPVEGAAGRQARRPTRSDGGARERQAGRLLPAPASVCSARRGCHSCDDIAIANI